MVFLLTERRGDPVGVDDRRSTSLRVKVCITIVRYVFEHLRIIQILRYNVRYLAAVGLPVLLPCRGLPFEGQKEQNPWPVSLADR